MYDRVSSNVHLRRDPPGTQLELRGIEAAVYEDSRKLEVVRGLEAEGNHDYLALLVCRNPVEKLVSVYNVMQDPRVSMSEGTVS